MSILNVEKLTHYYSDQLVFKEIDFRLLTNERVGLVGHNGSGKTTLLKILSGTLLPDQGKIERLPAVQIGYLEQHIHLNEGVTIQDYLRSAFTNLFELEKEMLQITEDMANSNPEILETQLNRYAQIQETLDFYDFYNIDNKVEEISFGLGIDQLGLNTDVSKLSGGQRTKLLLAKLLLTQPEILLLDEPTNFLDYGHIQWLKDYLLNYKNAYIVISHDTEFLNDIVNVIFHMEHKQLTRYVGNYKQFVDAYEKRKHLLHNAYNKQQEEIQKLETFIRKNKARASTSKQAKSREKRLVKMERINKPVDIPVPRYIFKKEEQPSSIIVETKDLVVGYTEPLLPEFTAKLKRGEKVSIKGHNGIGKSTMLKTIIGEIAPIGGEIKFGKNIKPAYLSQEWDTPSHLTPIDFITAMNEGMSMKEVRTALARAGIRNDHMYQSIHSLSGGEQTKVRLAQLMLEDCNWLILDEPTNHLDVQAKSALSEALENYEGSVLIVSHEPDFYLDWCTQIWDLNQYRN